jgi:polyphenol oxidase
MIEGHSARIMAVPNVFFGSAAGTGDDAVALAMTGRTLVRVKQIHSALCVEAGLWPDDARPEADALVTDRPGLALGIVTADCAPVLFADAEARVIGAAHAGWKGALGGVTDATIAVMEKLGATRANIAAAVGPCIARKSYEVDDAFRTRFTEHDPASERFFAGGTRPAHHQFDLEAYVVHRLAAAGLTRIEALGEDTYSQPSRFHSFRRATHQGAPDYGRQISLIALP